MAKLNPSPNPNANANPNPNQASALGALQAAESAGRVAAREREARQAELLEAQDRTWLGLGLGLGLRRGLGLGLGL